MNPKGRLLATAVFLLAGPAGPPRLSAAAPQPVPASDAAPETTEQRENRLAWWREARFGMFIHWGPVSLKGTEIGWSRAGERRGYRWSQGTGVPAEVYDNLYREFNPVQFDARAWVALARAAGMKYLVFTSRHHDGFSMFDTQAGDYKLTSPLSPFRRDVVRELAGACQAAGLKFGLYYSQPDWRHPDAFTPDRHALYLAYLRAQVRELLSNYGRVDILWFDGLGKTAADYDAVEINRMARALQPHILINNRNGLPEDFDTPEQRVGAYQADRPWESCITICRQWAWKPEDDMKSFQECIQTLVFCAGGDGNLLLNVGPTPEGIIEPRQAGRLKEMGAWLARHGESIYGTRGGPWKPTRDLASTRRGSTIYLHILRSEGGRVELPALPRTVTSAVLLDTGKDVPFQQAGGNLVLSIDPAALDPVDTIIRLELDGSAIDLPAMAVPPGIAAIAFSEP